jgi:RNA polymerase sigma factor for flagellar operon FliA
MTLAPADSKEVIARVAEQMDLVDIVARQLRRQLGTSHDLDDLRSAGREGLLMAARSFDEARGVPFRRWANLRIRGAIIDAIRQTGELPRRVHARLRAIEAGDRMQDGLLEEDAAAPSTTASEADQRLGAYLAGIATAMAIGILSPTTGPDPEDVRDTSETAEEQLAHRELVALIRKTIDRRPEAEKHLLVRHYFDGISFDDAAKELGLSKSWASRLHTRALDGLTKDLKRRV